MESNSTEIRANKPGRANRIAVIIVAIPAVTLVLLFEVFPYHPKSAIGWIVFVAVGVPAYLLSGWIAEKFDASRIGYKISTEKFSVLRIMVGVFMAAVVLALYCAGAYAYYRWFR